jgi:aspartyl protease family protein
MRDLLLFAGLTIGAVAALFPRDAGAPVSPPKEPAGAVAAAVATRPAVPPDPIGPPPAGRVELHRAADGHFYAPVTVGARPVTMLIDTGASVVALTGADARAAGVVWNPAQLRIVAQGAGGPVRGVAVRIERMRLGAQEARGVDAVVIPEGLPVSLLGQSFLRHLEPMRIERDRMLLGA